MTKQKIEPQEDLELHQNQEINNKRLFSEMVRNVRPEIWVIMDMLDTTGISPVIILQTIRHLNNISMGNKWGEVRILIENGVVKFIKGEESTRLEEPLILEKDPISPIDM